MNDDDLIQFTGPQGAFYLRPREVSAVGHVQSNPFRQMDEPDDRPVRFVSTHGGFNAWMWDAPENIARLLR